MNPVPLFLIIVSLPLLLGGCGEKATVEPVTEVKPVEEKQREVKEEVKPRLEGVNYKELESREHIYYLKNSETPYTGKVFVLYDNGRKKSELNFKDGKPDGLDTMWYKNGQKMLEGYWKDGYKDGLWVEWNGKGQRSSEKNFKGGKLDGLWVEWHGNGQKKLEGRGKDGKKEGLVTFWYENGKKKMERNYKGGKQDGLQERWHENGRKWMERKFKNGELISEKFWNSKGEPVATAEESFK